MHFYDILQIEKISRNGTQIKKLFIKLRPRSSYVTPS